MNNPRRPSENSWFVQDEKRAISPRLDPQWNTQEGNSFKHYQVHLRRETFTFGGHPHVVLRRGILQRKNIRPRCYAPLDFQVMKWPTRHFHR